MPQNGQLSRQSFLRKPLTADYRPTVSGRGWSWWDQRGFFTFWDVERMRRDPQIQLGLRTLRAPVHRVTWEVKSPSREVAAFVDRQLKRFWKNDLDKALAMLEYGACGGEYDYAGRDNRVEFRALLDRNFFDCAPLHLEGRFWGLDVRGAGSKAVRLSAPRAAWFINEPEFGAYYGRSRLAGAWEPWTEKRGRHGAVDSRRLWFHKNAFRGGTIRHPNGTIEVADGVYVSCQDYARELLEKFENGGVMAMPNARDEQGEYLWVYDPPASNGELVGVREYPGDLDQEILKGMGIPPEVLEASEVGSGWSGRSVPFLVFLSSEDALVHTVVSTFDRQCVRPMVWANYGPEARYEIEPQSLVPKDEPQQPPGGQPGQPPPQPGGPRPGGGLVPYQGQRGGQGLMNPATGRVQYGRLGFDPDAVRLAHEGGKGRWITIGGSKGEGGKRHGGSPVYVVNGRITKGAPSLTGKKIDALEEEAEGGTHRQQLNQSKGHARASWAKQARKEGIDPAELRQAAAEVLAHDREFAADRTRLSQEARKLSESLGYGNISDLRTRGASGKLDADAVKGLDDVAERMAERYPEQFAGHDNPEERLFDLLAEGNPEPVSEEDAYAHALETLRRRKEDEAGDADFNFGANRLSLDPPAEASRLVDAIIGQGVTTGLVIADEIRRKVLAALKKKRLPGKT